MGRGLGWVIGPGRPWRCRDPWGATVDDIEHPDTLVFDLDPGDGIEWRFLVEAAFRLREILAVEEHDYWLKTTGGKGLHLMVPIKSNMTWDAAHAYTRDVAERPAETAPDRYATSATVVRAGKLFIDFLRNGRETTAIGAYSPRARPGFPIVAPVTGIARHSPSAPSTPRSGRSSSPPTA